MSTRALKSGRRLFTFGWLIICLVFGGLLTWSIFAPFEGAVIATGSLTVQGNNQAVQHLDGGIVAAILVEEGHEVEAGDVVLRLDGAELAGALTTVDVRLFDLIASEARLIAEAEGNASFRREKNYGFTVEQPGLATAFDSQEQLFHARKSTAETKNLVLTERVGQLKQRIEGLQAEISAKRTQAGIVSEELQDLDGLLEKGLAPKSRVLALQRELAALEGEQQSKVAEIAQLDIRIGETKLEKLSLAEEFRERVAAELSDTKTEIAELLEQRGALLLKQERLDIRAPQTGRVLGINAHTVGGVVPPTEPVMHIVPQDEKLIALVRIPPRDIDKVSVGQTATLRLTAFNQNQTPEIVGQVLRLSADSITDMVTGAIYYEGVVEIPESLQTSDKISLIPGMPVDALLQTESRTVLSYLTKPLRDAISKTFRE